MARTNSHRDNALTSLPTWNSTDSRCIGIDLIGVFIWKWTWTMWHFKTIFGMFCHSILIMYIKKINHDVQKWLGDDSQIPKFIPLKIQRRDGIESCTTLEEGEFKIPIDSCIRTLKSLQSCTTFDFGNGSCFKVFPTKFHSCRCIWTSGWQWRTPFCDLWPHQYTTLWSVVLLTKFGGHKSFLDKLTFGWPRMTSVWLSTPSMCYGLVSFFFFFFFDHLWPWQFTTVWSVLKGSHYFLAIMWSMLLLYSSTFHLVVLECNLHQKVIKKK